MKIDVSNNDTANPVVTATGVVKTKIDFDQVEKRQTYTVEQKGSRLSIETLITPAGTIYTISLNGVVRLSGTSDELERFFNAFEDLKNLSSFLIERTRP